MPQVTTSVHSRIHVELDLTEKEARTLMGMLQNPLYDVHPDDEDEEEHALRSAIFHALHAEVYGLLVQRAPNHIGRDFKLVAEE